MVDKLNIFGLLLIPVFVLTFGLKGMTAEMGISIVACALFLAFNNLDKFSSFKGGGFEAELKQVVDEANGTIDNLRSVAAPLLATNIDLMASSGRWDDGSFEESLVFFDNLLALQKKVNLVDHSIERSKIKYLNITAWDIVTELAELVEKDNVGFYKKFSDSVGVHSYKKPPDMKLFKEMVKGISIGDNVVTGIDRADRYYAKYGLS